VTQNSDPRPRSAKLPSVTPSRPEHAVFRHLVAGFVVSALAGAADLVAAWAHEGQRVSYGEFALAGVYLVCFTLPLGVLAGTALGGWAELLSRSRWVAPLRARLGRGFSRDPEGFAVAVAALAGVGLFALGTQRAAHHFATRYHDPVLASWAMAATTLVLLGVMTTVAIAGRRPLRILGRALGPLASVGNVMLLALGVVLGGVAYALVAFPGILVAYSPWMLGILGGAVLVYALLAWLLGRRARRGRGTKRTALGCVVLALVGIVWSGGSYGTSNRVRAVVEQRSSLGRTLLRRYATLTDRDGDGHSFAFGGRDCDDSRADVHPGAPDEEGDGVDADCFDGDGSREVADFGNGAYGTRPEGLPEKPNFLFVTIDALRPDHLGSSGYERETSPQMDRFAEEAVVFERVYAQSSRSLRSVPAMMTGFYPSQIEFGGEYLWPALKRDNDTLAEVLGRAGYRCYVTMGTDYFVRVDDFFQGFHRINQVPIYKPPRERPIDDALDQLDQLRTQRRPWLLWVHLFNVHQPYLQDNRPSRWGDSRMDRYDTEIRLADAQVQRLLDGLDERGMSDETVVILASDHGEAFQEHGHFGHSTTLYGEELRSTLMMRVPGVEPTRVEERVGLLDLMPTILNLADVPVPRPMPARSLVPLLTGEGSLPEDRLLFSELLPDGMFPFDQKALMVGDEKLVYWVRDGTFQLFDLAEDPGELEDASDDEPERARELLGVLQAWMSQTNRPETQTARVLADNRLERFPPEMIPLDMQYDAGFRIVGYTIDTRELRPGDRLHVELYFEVLDEIEEDYFFYLDIKGPDGYVVPAHFHGHHFPLEGRYKTFQWRAGEKLRDPVEIVVPRQMRTPVTMELNLTVLEDHIPIGYRTANGRGAHTMPLGELEIGRP